MKYTCAKMRLADKFKQETNTIHQNISYETFSISRKKLEQNFEDWKNKKIYLLKYTLENA